MKMSQPYYRPIAALPFLVLLIVGCGQADDGKVQRVPVNGTLLVKSVPAVGARIVFYPKDEALRGTGMPTPGGTTEEDGSFSLTSYEPGDGAPVGDYVVTVVWREEIPEGKSLDTFQPKDRLNGRYASPDKSALSVSIPEGGGTLPPIQIP
jgi:hypothetical protein